MGVNLMSRQVRQRDSNERDEHSQVHPDQGKRELMLSRPETRITGLFVQYYVACKRELWLQAHHIDFHDLDENILLGRLFHEQSYAYMPRKELRLENAVFDVLDINDGDLVVLEMKKSAKMEIPARYQLLYYVWLLRQAGLRVMGVLAIPKQKKRIKVHLTKEEEKRLISILDDIPRIIQLPRPPPVEKKPYCKGCSFYYFCFT